MKDSEINDFFKPCKIGEDAGGQGTKSVQREGDKGVNLEQEG